VSVGERPELPDNENSPPNGRGNGKSSGGEARGKRGRPRRAAAAELEMNGPGGEGGTVVATRRRRGGGGGGGGDGGDGGDSGSGSMRERSLRRLLTGLHAVDAGDFSTRLEPLGDPLMAEIAEVFNSVVTKQGRLADELNRVAL
jgi:hypothetical protein